MWKALSWISSLLTGGVLDRILDTVDKRVEVESDRSKIKGDIIKEHISTRPNWLASGGFILCAAYSSVVLTYFGAIAVYSILWHQSGPFPQDWDIAALPQPMMEWAGWTVMASLGLTGLFSVKKI